MWKWPPRLWWLQTKASGNAEMLASSPTLLHHPATKKNSAAISYILTINPSSRSAQVDVAFPLADQLWGWKTTLLKSGATFENYLNIEFDANKQFSTIYKETTNYWFN